MYWVLLLSLLIHSSMGKKCRALVLSGGGDLGAYEASAYIELVNLLPDEESNYDVLTGVSAGSMNSAGLALFARDEGEQASDFIFGLWNSIGVSTVFKFWPGGLLEGLFYKSGLVDNTPLIDFVNEQTSGRKVARKVSYAATDTDNADYYVMDYNVSDTLPDDYVQAAIASSSIPAVFEHVQRDGRTLIDGGMLWNVDIPSAVRRCKEIVDDDTDIIIDIVSCFGQPPILPPTEDLDRYTALGHYRRSLEIKSFYEMVNRVESGKFLYPKVNFRYIISPSEGLLSIKNPIPLLFTKDHTNKCFAVGKKDTENAIKLGPGVYFEVVKEYRDKVLAHEPADLAQMIEERVNNTSKPLFESS